MPTDLEESMAFDPEDGIADLDTHLDRLKAAAEGQGFKFDRHAARNELQAATFGKRTRQRARCCCRRPARWRSRSGRTKRRAGSAAAGPNRHQRRRFLPDRLHDFGMMGVQPAG